MKCPNCGNPAVKNGVCEYCGSVFEDEHLKGSIDEFNGELTIGGHKFNVYLANVETHNIAVNIGRALDGRFVQDDPIVKRTFKLIEM